MRCLADTFAVYIWSPLQTSSPAVGFSDRCQHFVVRCAGPRNYEWAVNTPCALLG